MPRAKIPYDLMNAYVKDKYQSPVFVRARVNRRERGGYGGFTPIRVYDRQTGNYAPYGWLFEIEYIQFTGSFRNLNPIYGSRITQKIVVSDSDLDSY